MKVKELTPGMMLVPAEKDDRILLATKYVNQEVPWARVVYKGMWRAAKNNYAGLHRSFQSGDHMIYVGTKKDVGIDLNWCNRFALLNGELVGVDPSAWRHLMPMKDGDEE